MARASSWERRKYTKDTRSIIWDTQLAWRCRGRRKMIYIRNFIVKFNSYKIITTCKINQKLIGCKLRIINRILYLLEVGIMY